MDGGNLASIYDKRSHKTLQSLRVANQVQIKDSGKKCEYIKSQDRHFSKYKGELALHSQFGQLFSKTQFTKVAQTI